MRSFAFGVMVGAIAMYLNLQGFGPIITVAQGWWAELSAPQRNALQQ